MKKYKINILLLLMMLTVAGSVILNSMFKQLIVDSHNQQAKLELHHIKTCFNSTNGSITDKLNKCASNSLVGGRTGDVFAVNLKDMKIVWDNSRDCKTSKTMYLTKDSVCKLAKGPESCERLAKQIKLGYDGKYSWNFDGKKEYDNWIVIPDNTHNFDGSVRATAGEKDQIALVQGFQEDEIMARYSFLSWANKIVTFIMLLLFSFLLILEDKEYKRR